MEKIYVVNQKDQLSLKTDENQFLGFKTKEEAQKYTQELDESNFYVNIIEIPIIDISKTKMYLVETFITNTRDNLFKSGMKIFKSKEKAKEYKDTEVKKGKRARIYPVFVEDEE
jgi:hypothetical protein